MEDRLRSRAAGVFERSKSERRACFALALLLVLFVLLLVAMADGAHGAEPIDCSQYGFPTPIVDEALSDGQAVRNGPIAFAYDARAGAPLWTMAIVSRRTLAGTAERGEFTSDERVPRGWRVVPGDFTNSGGDRGHLEPAADFGGQAATDASFRMTNIAWQDSDLNQNFWAREIEERGVRGPVREEGLVAVPVTVVMYPQAVRGKLTIETIGPRDVWKPDRWGKAVLFVDEAGKPVRMRAWIVPNKPVARDASEADYRVSVDELELAARLELYWKLDDELEDRLEASK